MICLEEHIVDIFLYLPSFLKIYTGTFETVIERLGHDQRWTRPVDAAVVSWPVSLDCFEVSPSHCIVSS